MRKQTLIALPVWIALITGCMSGAGMAQTLDRSEMIAEISLELREVKWQPRFELQFDRLELTVSIPSGEVLQRTFDSGTTPRFSLTGEDGAQLPDGHYKYELRLVPHIDEGVKQALAASREETDPTQTERALRISGALPAASAVQSGSFLVLNGRIVTGSLEEGGRHRQPGEGGGSGDPGRGGRKKKSDDETVTPQDQVIPDDLIVQASICAGFDCVNNESFGFDTIRLKENNTRIKFEDTSVGTFPSTDWQLTANDSASGGLNRFSIEDITMGRVPFTVEGGAPTNSLYVDDGGRIGLRTSTPVLDLHLVDTDSPAFRLDQSSAGGFTPQVWDIAGNEANFFVRDVTSGSRLPFRIRPGAPTSSIDIAASGNVGIGTASPSQKLHVKLDTNANVLAVVDNANDGLNANATVRVQSSGATANFQAHATARTISRFGVTLGGWSEFLHFTGNGLAIGTFGSAPLILGTNSANRIHITPTGDVGIGTSTPAGKLDVNGTILQRGVLLHADYVFEPDYKLESIEDHAAFMWRHKHLPAMAPRKVDAEGREVIEIGRHTRGMLEELEKAHIYIVQLNDKISEKEKQIAKLELQNTELAERLARIEAALAASEKSK